MKVGVSNAGESENTKLPVPDSSEMVPANSAEVVAAKSDNLLLVVARVPVVGRVIFVAAVVVSVSEKAPLVANAPAVEIFPPRVMVIPVFATPVPPFAPVRMPPSVTAPVVAELGVSPVVPAENEVTFIADSETHAGSPLDIVRSCPSVPLGSFESVLAAEA